MYPKTDVSLVVLALTLPVFCQHFDGFDDGYFADCVPGLMDLTFLRTSTDGLEITLVRYDKPFKRFAIHNVSNILKDREFNISRKTMLFAHGWVNAPLSNDHVILSAYLSKPEYNVLFFDSSTLINDLNYLRAARAARYIGSRLGIALAQMVRAGLNVDTFEVTGYSLGAHIIGFAGKSYTKITGKKLPLIVGFDPAGGCFRQALPKNRLDKGDALFVQAIHTNGGGLGLVNAVGHVDFYVNGGRSQPSEYGLLCLSLCSHFRVLDIWNAAMATPKGFIGVECPNVDLADKSNCYTSGKQRTAIMGPNADPSVSGIFYIRTSRMYPFYLGTAGTKPVKIKD